MSRRKTIKRGDKVDGRIVPSPHGTPWVRCLTPDGWAWHRVEHVEPWARTAQCRVCEERKRAGSRELVRGMVSRAMRRGGATGGA